MNSQKNMNTATGRHRTRARAIVTTFAIVAVVTFAAFAGAATQPKPISSLATSSSSFTVPTSSMDTGLLVAVTLSDSSMPALACTASSSALQVQPSMGFNGNSGNGMMKGTTTDTNTAQGFTRARPTAAPTEQAIGTKAAMLGTPPSIKRTF